MFATVDRNASNVAGSPIGSNGDQPVTLGPGSLAVLRLLIDAGGTVVTKDRLLTVLPDTSNEHAVEAAIGRIRKGLHHKGLIATVTKRGYRLDT